MCICPHCGLDTEKKKPDLDFSCLGFTESQQKDFIRIRKSNKGSKLTQRIINALAKEFHDAASKGFTFDELLTEWEVRGWKSFKSEWIKPRKNNELAYSTQASYKEFF